MLGIGLFPRMPGTIASIVAAALYLWLLAPLSPLHAAVAVLLVIAVGVPICHQAERVLGAHDPSEVVWDELAGTWLALLLVPAQLQYQLAALVAFRLLDIFKPWPVGALQKLPGGWGVMADDLAAGLLAAGAVSLVALAL